MLNNNNKAFIRSLSRSCLKTSKNRNIIAVLAIILTSLLFTSVATIVEGSIQTTKEQEIRMSGSKFMMSIKYISEEANEKLLKEPAFSEIGRLQYLGDIEEKKLRKIGCDFSWANKTYIDGVFTELQAGKLPEKGNEILVDNVVLEMLGFPAEIGTEIPLTYWVNDEKRKETMKVCGIYKGEANEMTSTIYISRPFLEKQMEGISVPEDGTAGAGSILLYVSFPSEKNLEQQRAEVLKKAGFHPDAERGEEGFVISNISTAYDNSDADSPAIFGAAALLILIILLAGYLIISNIFRISIIKDLRMYGQLKTIGASPKQLQKLMIKQADLLNLIGIPIGLILGFFLGKGLLPVVMQTTIYKDVQEIQPRALVFLVSALFSFLTVRISCRRPVKMMSKMSPMQALRYQGKESAKRSRKGGESRQRILRMAFSNLSQNKGKTFFVVLSLSLSIVILNSVLNFTACFDEKTFVKGQSGADFIVSHIEYGVRNESEQNVVPREFVREAKKRTDTAMAGRVYCYQAPDEEAEASMASNAYDGVQTAKVQTVNGKPYSRQIEMGKMLFGLDEEVWKRCKVVRGQLDMEKLKTGKYIVEGTDFINNGEDYSEELFSLKPGDKVKAVIGDCKLEYEVLANVVLPTQLLFSSSMGEGGYFILPSEEYLRQFPGRLPIHYVMDAKEGSFADIDAFLKNYEKKPQANIKYESVEKVVENFQQFRGTYSTTGTVLAVIFGVIGLLNLLNVILAGAVARQREFAIMQSIGMTRKQLRRLFMIEGILYSAIAGILSLILSAIFSFTTVKGLCSLQWFCVYHFSLLPAGGLIPVYLAVSAGIAFVIDKLWNSGSVTDKLRISK